MRKQITAAISAGLLMSAVAADVASRALAQAPAANPAQIEASPEATVRALYRHVRKTLAPDGGRLGAPWEARNRARFFTPRLQKLFAADEIYAKKQGGLGRLDFDPFIDGQDGEIKDLSLKTLSADDRAATILAQFTSFGAPRKIVFSLAAEPAGWRIDEVRATHEALGWTLSKILSGRP